MRTRQLFTALVALATVPGIAASQRLTGAAPGRVPAPVTLEREGLFQDAFSRLGDDLFIGGQPTERALRELRAQGVTTIVNLRTPEEMVRDVKFDERALAASLGMKYVYLPVRGTPEYPYSPETVTKFADALGKADGKVLLHCTIAWRASHLWAAYLISRRGMQQDSALANARAINLMDGHRMSASGLMPVEEFLGRRIIK